MPWFLCLGRITIVSKSWASGFQTRCSWSGSVTTPHQPVLQRRVVQPCLHSPLQRTWLKYDSRDVFSLHNMANGRYVTALHNYLQGRSEQHLLSWKESSEGPPNALVWTAVCKVRGQMLGSGTAGQIRTAREQAAQSACQALGIPA